MGGGDMPGGGGRGRKSKDAIQEFEVSLEELFNGKHVKLMSKRKVICSNCKGYTPTTDDIRGNLTVERVEKPGRSRKSVLPAVEVAKKSLWTCSTDSLKLYVEIVTVPEA